MTSSQLQLIAHLFDRSATDINYWWVNHKQTFREEIGGRYICFAKKNRDGGQLDETKSALRELGLDDHVKSEA